MRDQRALAQFSRAILSCNERLQPCPRPQRHHLQGVAFPERQTDFAYSSSRSCPQPHQDIPELSPSASSSNLLPSSAIFHRFRLQSGRLEERKGSDRLHLALFKAAAEEAEAAGGRIQIAHCSHSSRWRSRRRNARSGQQDEGKAAIALIGCILAPSALRALRTRPLKEI